MLTSGQAVMVNHSLEQGMVASARDASSTCANALPFRRPMCTRVSVGCACLAASVTASAALKAQYLTSDQVPADLVASEKDVLTKKTLEEGKPEAALPRIVEGRVNGFFKENVLLEQPFAKEPKKTVAKVLEESGADAKGFVRYRVGA